MKRKGWKGESRRHSLARKGIKTNIDGGRRFDVSNFVAKGNDRFLQGWTNDYLKAVEKNNAKQIQNAKVIDVYGEEDRMGGIAIYVIVENQKSGYEYKFTPYYDQSPSEEDTESFRADPDAWIDSMYGATNWDEWEWFFEGRIHPYKADPY